MRKVALLILSLLMGLVVVQGTYAQAALRDPTQPPGSSVKILVSGGDIKIQAIFYNKTKPSIIVDNKYYYEGDALSGAIIVKIGQDDVVLRGEGGEMTVSMYPSIREPVPETEKKGSNDSKR